MKKIMTVFVFNWKEKEKKCIMKNKLFEILSMRASLDRMSSKDY